MEQELNSTLAAAIEQQEVDTTVSDLEIPQEIKDQISEKIKTIKAEKKIKKIYAIVVEGDEGDSKPYYIGYFKRPSFKGFSMWMNQLNKDTTVANKLLAQHSFIEGDKEMIDDDDVFLYGTMSHLTELIESRKSELVKV